MQLSGFEKYRIASWRLVGSFVMASLTGQNIAKTSGRVKLIIAQIRDAAPKRGFIQSLLAPASMKAWTLTGIVTVVAGLFLQPAGVLEPILRWAGLGAAVIPSGVGGLKRLGIGPADYEGKQWPFFYAFG